MTLIRWGAPGPYVVAFTTRLGGVSAGPYESLNLGARGDDPARVAENRRIACDELGLDDEALSVNHQRHSPSSSLARTSSVSRRLSDGSSTTASSRAASACPSSGPGR